MEVILEVSGYMKGLDNLVKYICQMITERLIGFLRMNRIRPLLDGSDKDVVSTLKAMLRIPDIDRDEPIERITFNSSQLEKLNAEMFGSLEVICDMDCQGASFNHRKMRIGNDGKLYGISIRISPALVLYKKGLLSSIHHELVHVYEMAMRYSEKKKEKTDNEMNRRFYSTNVNSDIVKKISYYFSDMEEHAVISQFSYDLERLRADRKTYRDVYDNSSLKEFINNVISIRDRLLNDDSIIYDIIRFVKSHPEHKGMFPSIRNTNIQSYRKRMLGIADKKLERLKNLRMRAVMAHFKRNGI